MGIVMLLDDVEIVGMDEHGADLVSQRRSTAAISATGVAGAYGAAVGFAVRDEAGSQG